MTDVTIAALPVAVSIADSDLIIVEEIGTPNVTKRATAAQMRATSLPLTGGTMTGALTVNAALTVNSTGKFTNTLTLNASGGWSSSNVGKQLLLTTPAGVSNPALGFTDANGINLFGIYNNAGTLKIASMPAYTDGATAPTDVVQVTATAVTLNKGLSVTGNTKITGTLETTGKTTVDAGGLTVTAGGVTVTADGITVTAGGATVSAGGVTVTGNSTITGTLGGLTGLTVASGGANVTGNSTVTGTLDVTTAGGSGNQVVNFSQFASSVAASGYTKLPNGIIIQWGTAAVAAALTTTINFPLAFPTACFMVTATLADGGIPAPVLCSIGTPTATNFPITLIVSTTAAVTTGNAFFIAVGH